MRADLSRGHNPDRKRNKQYRRVLLQQGRVLLDSDVASLVDTNDRLLRQQSEDLATEAGGHDRAFMITPGRLYATFRDLSGVQAPASGAALLHQIDYATRFRTRFPSLRLDGPSATAGSLRINLFAPHQRTGNLVLWLRRDALAGPPTAAGFITDLSGNPYTVSPAGALASLSTTFQRFEFTPPNANGTDAGIILNLQALQRVWVALIESDSIAGAPFWIQPGRFHIRGLMVSSDAETAWPAQAFPTPAPLTIPSGQAAIAYLEGWERTVTAIEDPGLRERALSQGLDTSVRTQSLGQVKVFSAPASSLTPAAVRAAFERLSVPTGQLVLATSATQAASSPCEITIEGGFTGRENHLYHFEVQAFELSSNALRMKWSREAASELFAVEDRDGANIFVRPETGLRDGDLVEVLSDVIDLGDGAPGAIAAGQFRAPTRLVGHLARLLAVAPTTPGLSRFRLEPAVASGTSFPDATLYPVGQPLRLRRWHGLIEVTVPAASVPIENGLELAISGTFEVGDYWQFEARLTPNAGAVSPLRHGPERLFAALALLTGDAGRPEVSEWLDQPFVPAARASADNIRFDASAASAVGFTDLVTLQAVLDRLLTHGPGQRIVDRITHEYDGSSLVGSWQMTVGDATTISQGTISFGDFNGPDAIQRAVGFVRALVGAPGGNQNPWSLRVLVKRGTYVINDGSRIVLGPGESLFLEGEGGQPGTGAPARATSIQCDTTSNPAFDAVGTGSRIELENLQLIGGAAAGTFGVLAARSAGELRISRCRLANRSILLRGVADSAPPQYSLQLRECTLEATVASPLLNVEFPSTANGTCPAALVDGCRISVPVNGGFAAIGSAANPVRFDGLTLRATSVQLGGSNAVVSPGANPGLVALQPSAFADGMLAIGDLVFEDCRVDAGGPSVNGVLLHLASGNDPTQDRRVRGIDNVVIRGGRWTVRTEVPIGATSQLSGPGPLYVGDRTFDPANVTATRISNLVVEKVAFGWSNPIAVARYATPLVAPLSTFSAAERAQIHAFVFSADTVLIRDVRFFGCIANSQIGELSVLGSQSARIDGLQLEDFQAIGANPIPATRVLMYCGARGLSAANVSVVGAGNLATAGAIFLRPAGAASTAQRALLTNCRVRNNANGDGFNKSTDALDVELVDCSAIECRNGVFLSQTVVGATPSTLVVRGGRFSNNSQNGVAINLFSRLVAVTIEGATCTGNAQAGISVVPSFGANPTWEQRGPNVLHNRAHANSGQFQIVLGSDDTDEIGGVCLGNYCASAGLLRVNVAQTYFMRGLSAHNEAPWATRTRVATAASGSALALNAAAWSRT